MNEILPLKDKIPIGNSAGSGIGRACAVELSAPVAPGMILTPMNHEALMIQPPEKRR